MRLKQLFQSTDKLEKILKLTLMAAVLLFIQNSANAQTALEQQCYNDVQGKVAWNQAGNTTWGEGNIRNLCQGTTNPSATIACFQAEIKQHNDWNRGITACLPERSAVNSPTRTQAEIQAQRPPEPENVRTVTFKNNASIQATLSVGGASSGQLNIGESKTVNIKESIGTPLQVTVTMRLPNPDYFVIYRGTISGDNRATNFCFEARGDVGNPSVAPCNGTQATEAKKVEFRNEAGFIARPTLHYFVGGVAKSVSAEDIPVGIKRVLYLPADADKDKDITLNSTYIHISGRFNLSSIRIDRNSGSPLCYKVWGTSDAAKISPCSPNPSARRIKFKNMGGFNAQLSVNYYDQNQKLQSISGNRTDFLETDVMEIPQEVSAKPIEINFIVNDGFGKSQRFATKTVPANFTGEVCFKTEGTVFNPNASTCDDELNATPGVDSRQIVFRNEAGYDAQIFIQYFELQDVGGTKVPMPKNVVSGFINLGKSRTITIPKDTAPNMPIQIFLQGNTTLKNDIFSTTLPWDFKSSPVPCFKTWDTLFTPKGGKCN